MKSLGILLVIVAGLAPAQEPEQTVQSSIADSASSGWVTSYGGHVAAEARWFTTPALDSRQSDFAPSFVLAPQLKLANKEYGVAFNATPFGRFDFQDERRTHADLREFNLSARFDARRIHHPGGRDDADTGSGFEHHSCSMSFL